LALPMCCLLGLRDDRTPGSGLLYIGSTWRSQLLLRRRSRKITAGATATRGEKKGPARWRGPFLNSACAERDRYAG
jgi:hypothetical protein